MSAQGPDLENPDPQLLKINWTGRAGKVEDKIQWSIYVNKVGHVVLHEAEPGIAQMSGHVFGAPGEQVIHADDLIALGKKKVAQMRTDKT